MRDRVAPCEVPLHRSIRGAFEKVTKIFQLIFMDGSVYYERTLKALWENKTSRDLGRSQNFVYALSAE